MDVGNGTETRLLDNRYKRDLKRRIITRSIAEWPGHHTTPIKAFVAGPVQAGGATDTLIRFVTDIAIEEVERDPGDWAGGN